MYRVRYELKREHELFVRYDRRREGVFDRCIAAATRWAGAQRRGVFPAAMLALVLIVCIAIGLQPW